MSVVLDKVDYPSDLKKLDSGELESLAGEIREYLIEAVSTMGGHFAPNLGVVELTLALLYVFSPPRDKIIWDVGHQCYVYKLLTGRKDGFRSLRRHRGLSGYPKIAESEFDAFGTGHASTSISAALGIAASRDLRGDDYEVISVTGDGAMTGGLAYEGLNNAGTSGRKLMVVLNDNEMSISKNVGALSRYLTRITTNPRYTKTKEEILNLTSRIPALGEGMHYFARRLDESLKGMIVPGSLFESLGFKYYGPLDGHDMDEMISTFKNLKSAERPVIVHILTKKGKGYRDAENRPHIYHGLGPFDRDKGKTDAEPSKPSFSEVFGKSAVHFAGKNRKVTAITAAMSEGTGLTFFEDAYPDRFFDVGIAEGHATTFAAAMASRGHRPIVAVYSTFLQRAYDQIIHDVALQKLPVVFCLDRSGLVGADGPTHHGSFDISFLNIVPDLIVAAPRNGDELYDLLGTALEQDENPFVIRYPKGSTEPVEYGRSFNFREIGKWEVIRKGGKVGFLAIGSMVDPALKAAEILDDEGLSPEVVNCLYSKPMDEEMLKRMGSEFDLLVTLEENSEIGGFGARVSGFLYRNGKCSCGIINLGIPDRFIEHGSRSILLEEINLSPEKIAAVVRENMDDK